MISVEVLGMEYEVNCAELYGGHLCSSVQEPQLERSPLWQWMCKTVGCEEGLNIDLCCKPS